MNPIVTLRRLKRRLLAASIVAAVAGSAAMAQAQSLAINQTMLPSSEAMGMAGASPGPARLFPI